MAPVDAQDSDAYRTAWSEVARSMEDGVSWSGHEHNVAWLNLGGGAFVDVSIVAGLDHVEDGRVVVRTDWDRDGDIDLWLRSRNGPSLRYLENQSNPEAWVEIPAQVGAPGFSVVTEDENGRTLRSYVARPSSDGYLAGPSRRMVVAWDDAPHAVEVRTSETDLALRLVMDDSTLGGTSLTPVDGAFEWQSSPVARRAGTPSGALSQTPLPTRVVLRTPLPLPGERLSSLAEGTGARLVIVKSADCPTCERTVPPVLSALEGAGDVLTITTHSTELDDIPSGSSDAAFVHAAAASMVGPGSPLGLPLALLIDGADRLQVIYTGGLEAAQVQRDARWFALQPVQGAMRSTAGPPGESGRWFHGLPRAFTPLIRDLQALGLAEDATYYSSLRR